MYREFEGGAGQSDAPQMTEQTAEEQERMAESGVELEGEQAVELDLSAGGQGLPDILPTPVVRTGLST